MVLDLDDPKVSQYSGFFLVGCRESKKLSSCSKLCNVNPVFEVKSASLLAVFSFYEMRIIYVLFFHLVSNHSKNF